MLFSEVIVSYPYKRYEIEISHFTSKKPIVIEWVILEAIKRCEELNSYLESSIEAFFDEIFEVSDANKLILPCIINLQDLGVISASDIDDDTDLKTVCMNKLKLTSLGKKMQLQGLLPGKRDEEMCTVYYDFFSSQQIKKDKGHCSETSTGININGVFEEKFPEMAIRKWLYSVQKEGKIKSMRWLTPTTEIKEITEKESRTFWKNISKKIIIENNMQWKIENEEGEEISEILLKEMNLPYSEEFEDLNIENIDEEISKFINLDDIQILIDEYLRIDDLFFIEEKYYKEIEKNQLKKNKIRIGIIYNSKEFNIEYKEKERQLIFKIPEHIINTQELYFNLNRSIKRGNITVTAGKTSRKFTLAFIPKKNNINIREIIESLVNNYFEKDRRVLFLFKELNLKNLFLSYLTYFLANINNLNEKDKVINELNSNAVKYYGKKEITSEYKEKLLINEEKIKSRINSVTDIENILKEYGSISSFKREKNLFQKILKIIFDNTRQYNKLEDIWSLWDEIIKIERTHINWINEEGLYKNIYSKESIIELLKSFTSKDFLKINDYTFVEQIILKMNKIFIGLEEALPEINLKENLSKEKINEALLNHKNILKELYEQLRQWEDEERKFDTRIFRLEDLLNSKILFSNIINNIRKFRESISRFFDDSFMQFNKVYIIDTNGLMDSPEIISLFEDEKSLLVIPRIVLNELDKLKTSENEERAFKAREAIRRIDEYKSNKWLNIKEDTYPELLSKDIEETNDTKILSIAIKYMVKNPTILTNDINLGNIASSYQINNLKVQSYISKRKYEKENNKENLKKSKKKSKKNLKNKK